MPLEGPQAAVQEAIQSQPRALTTDSRLQQQAGQVLSKVPFVGERLGRAIEAVPEKFGEARNTVADQLGDYRTPQNVAGDIGEHLGDAANVERKAAEEAAARTDAAAQAEYERANLERQQAIAQREQASTQATQQQIGSVAPVVMGNVIGDTVRSNHEAVRGAKDAAYREAGGIIDAAILDRASKTLNGSIRARLRADRAGQGTVDLTAEAVPAARGMMTKIKAFSDDAQALLGPRQRTGRYRQRRTVSERGWRRSAIAARH